MKIEEIEKVLGKEYVVFDGEQKVYVLPENVDVDELLSNFKGLRAGEIKQSQMWRKTDANLGTKEQSDMVAAMDKRIQQLEILLSQVLVQAHKVDQKSE